MTAIKLQRQSSVRIQDEPDRTLADPITRGFAQVWRLGVARLICVLSDNRLLSAVPKIDQCLRRFLRFPDQNAQGLLKVA